jgi:hypothetical protein
MNVHEVARALLAGLQSESRDRPEERREVVLRILRLVDTFITRDRLPENRSATSRAASYA